MLCNRRKIKFNIVAEISARRAPHPDKFFSKLLQLLLQTSLLATSDIPVLKIISVLVSIKFELNHFSISFYTVSELFSVLVSIKFL